MANFTQGADRDYRTEKEKLLSAALDGSITLDDFTERRLLFEKCNTRNELKAWIKYFLEFALPDNVVSRYSNCSPFHVVWEIYSIAVLGINPDEIQELLYCGGRGSGKCSLKGSLLLTLSGIKKIEDVKIEDIVYTGWRWEKVLNTFDEGVKPGIKITTYKNQNKNANIKYGAFDTCGSLNHRIQAFNSETKRIDWVYLTDLKKDQWIYKSAFSPYKIDTTSKDYELGWLCGAITGDGCINHERHTISFSGKDLNCINHFIKVSNKYFNTIFTQKGSCDYIGSNVKDILFWYGNLVEGNLCYFKKLKTIEHTPNFLAGFISGIADTDGSCSEIEMANKNIIEQISKIYTIFGISSSVVNNSRKPSTTKFVSGYKVTYHRCKINTRPHDFLLPMFGKRSRDIKYWDKVNNQFSYPVELFEEFAIYMHKKYKNPKTNKWLHKELRGTRTDKKMYGWKKISHFIKGKPHKNTYGYINKRVISKWIDVCCKLNEKEWVEYLTFILNGYFEKVYSTEKGEYYFYDIEVDKDHSYWSNGFISHNTLSTAIAEFICILHAQRDVAHIGVILPQAERCYAYLQEMVNKKRIKRHLIPDERSDYPPVITKMNMKKTTFEINGNVCAYEILPCTMQALNGKHADFVSTDELDTADKPEVLKAFKEISGILDSRPGKKSLRVGISTRKSKYGLMNSMMENAEKEGRTVREWTSLEFTEKCPIERYKTRQKFTAWIDQDNLICLNEEEYNKLPNTQKKPYVRYEIHSGCFKCAAVGICFGDLVNQNSTPDMLKPISDITKKIKEAGPDWALSQLVNLKPSMGGLVYREYSPQKNIKTWNEMWEHLTGREFPGVCSHDIFVKKCREMNLTCLAGVDFGWNVAAFVCLYIDNKENIYIVRADAAQEVNDPTWIHFIKTTYHNMYGVEMYYPDCANPSNIDVMTQAGLNVAEYLKKDILLGIQTIKRFLRVPGTTNTKIFLAEETTKPMQIEFQQYHFKIKPDGTYSDLPEKEYDHTLDSFRYIMLGTFAEGGLSFSVDEDIKNPLRNQKGEYLRIPTAAEFAEDHGIPFNNNTADADKKPKIGTLSELYDQNEDDDDIF